MVNSNGLNKSVTLRLRSLKTKLVVMSVCTRPIKNRIRKRHETLTIFLWIPVYGLIYRVHQYENSKYIIPMLQI